MFRMAADDLFDLDELDEIIMHANIIILYHYLFLPPRKDAKLVPAWLLQLKFVTIL